MGMSKEEFMSRYWNKKKMKELHKNAMVRKYLRDKYDRLSKIHR